VETREKLDWMEDEELNYKREISTGLFPRLEHYCGQKKPLRGNRIAASFKILIGALERKFLK
jgi:hypothetical protein